MTALRIKGLNLNNLLTCFFPSSELYVYFPLCNGVDLLTYINFYIFFLI